MERRHDESTFIPPGLAAIAAGRDFIKTEECAHALGFSAGTIRNQHSKTGRFCGMAPIKLGRHLLWPVHEVAALLRGDPQ